MRARIYRVVRFANSSLFINEIADPFWKAGFWAITGPIRKSDSPFSIAEERKGKCVFIGECRVLGKTIETNTDNLHVPSGKFVNLVAEPAALRGSTRCVCLGVKPQQYFFPSLRSKREITSSMDFGGKVWSNGSYW